MTFLLANEIMCLLLYNLDNVQWYTVFSACMKLCDFVDITIWSHSSSWIQTFHVREHYLRRLFVDI